MTTTRRGLAVRPGFGALLTGAIAAALVGSLVQLAHGGVRAMRPGSMFESAAPDPGNLDPTGIVLVAGATLPLLASRRFPLGVFTLTAAAGVLLAGLDYPLDLMLGPAVALFLLAASRSPQAPWARSTTAVVAGSFLAYLVAAGAARGEFPGSELLHSGLLWAVAWFAGERTRLRREHIADLRERAWRAEREAERERLLAAADERARIARDLHDSAGHAINVIAVRAGAARLRHAEDPERSRLALEEIEALARQTAAEIDQIVGSLREGTADGPPGLAALDALIARHAAAGLDVSLDTTGSAPALGSVTDQAAYRILQEALTNAARHGTGRAHVEIVFSPAVEITVSNPVPHGGTSRPGGGHGLIGMRERAGLLGGDLEVAHDDGSFRLHAWLPDQAGAP